MINPLRNKHSSIQAICLNLVKFLLENKQHQRQTKKQLARIYEVCWQHECGSFITKGYNELYVYDANGVLKGATVNQYVNKSLVL
jgi:hypothetical protein